MRLWCYRQELITDRHWCHVSCRLEGKLRDGLLWVGLWLGMGLYGLFWRASKSFDKMAHKEETNEH
jgi:hypothetical protein